MPDCAENFLAAYNERDWERMRATMVAGCRYEEVGRPRRHADGADEVVSVFQGWAGAVPEARAEVVSRVADAGGVALEVDWIGALKGPFGDFSPSGRPPVAKAAMVFRLDDGLIAAVNNYYDSLVLYQVLGIHQ